MFAFLIGSLSVIGLPPLGGSWSKWLIGLGALDAGFGFVIGVLMLSSLLNVAYLMPIVARAFFVPGSSGAGPGGEARGRIEEAPLACVVPLMVTSALCLVLFFFAGEVERLIAPVVAKPWESP
jgi:multicomponent Na+:H+ antiporter subunit D